MRCVQYDGKLVVSGAYDYMVKIWNPERQECLHTLQGHTNRVYSLQVNAKIPLFVSIKNTKKIQNSSLMAFMSSLVPLIRQFVCGTLKLVPVSIHLWAIKV